MLDLDNISHNCCPWPKGVSWFWPKVIPPRSRSQCTHTQNPCPGHNSSLPCWIWIIFHTIVVHDPRMCHDLDSRSYLQGQGHSALIHKIHVWAITLHCHVGSGKYFTQLLSMTWGWVMPWPKVITPRSQCTHTRNPYLGHNSLVSSWMVMT